MMRSLLPGALCLGLAATLAVTTGQDESPKLQGTWLAREAERNGKSAADVVGHRLTFAGEQFRIVAPDGKVLQEGTFRVDLKTTPPAITFTHAAGALKGTFWEGIFALEGDTLRICDN